MTLSGFAIALKILMFFGMLIGLAGMVVPVFPGVTVIWALTLLYGLIFGFHAGGAWFFGVLTLLAVIGWGIDNVLMGSKAKLSGARWSSLALAFVAGFVGSIFLTPLGGIIITLLALYLGEYLHRHDRAEAWRITKEMALGWGWSFIARFAIGMTMIGLWAIWAW